MLWPTGRALSMESMQCADGYTMRLATAADAASFRALMEVVDLGTWDDETLARTINALLPSGWRVIVHTASGDLVATGMAHYRPLQEIYPNGYEVGWIAAHPDHSGHRLGRTIVAATTSRLMELGAECIYLQTDDFRLPAIRTYLDVGFVPHLWAPGMADRWRQVCKQIGWPYTPSAWPPS